MTFAFTFAYAIGRGILDALTRRPHLEHRLAVVNARAAFRDLARAKADARRAVRDAERQYAEAHQDVRRARDNMFRAELKLMLAERGILKGSVWQYAYTGYSRMLTDMFCTHLTGRARHHVTPTIASGSRPTWSRHHG
jgi:uncharacterized protein YqfA (UPF0365 family)